MLRSALLAVVLVLLALPSVAGAATASVDGGTLVLTGSEDSPNLRVEMKDAPCGERVNDRPDGGGDPVKLDDPAGCVQLSADVQVGVGPGCRYLGFIRPEPTRVICGLSGVSSIVVRGSAANDVIVVGPDAQRRAIYPVPVRVEGGPGNDVIKVDQPAPRYGSGLVAQPFAVDGGDGDDDIEVPREAAVATVVCGAGNDKVGHDDLDDVGLDCETFAGARRGAPRAGSLPGVAGMEGGTLVLDARRYTASAVLHVEAAWVQSFRGRSGWTIREERRRNVRRDELAAAVAFRAGAGCEPWDGGSTGTRLFCAAEPATPVLVRGPAQRTLSLRLANGEMTAQDEAGAPPAARVRVEGGARDDVVEILSPLHVTAVCGGGLDTVVGGTERTTSPQLGANTLAEGDCEMPLGIARIGTPQFGRIAASARGVVGNRRRFPLAGIGALVKVTCPAGVRLGSCGGKLDLYAAGKGCGYLATTPYTVPAGRTVTVPVQFGTIEGRLRCGSLLEPRSRVARALRTGKVAKLRVVARLGRHKRATPVRLRR